MSDLSTNDLSAVKMPRRPPRIELSMYSSNGIALSWRAIAYYDGGEVETAPKNSPQEALEGVLQALAENRMLMTRG